MSGENKVHSLWKDVFSLAVRMSVEWWAEMGGKVANTKQKPDLANKTGKAAPRKKLTGKGGVKTLREAADKAVGENSDVITASLLEKARNGDVASTKLLCSLAEPQAARKNVRKSQRRRTMAMKLAEEPEYSDELAINTD